MSAINTVSTSRRTFVKGVLATSTGIATAAYVKPSLRALGVPGALAQISTPPAQITPVDSSVSTSDDPNTPLTEPFPLLPSAGDGGPSDSSSAQSASEPPSSDSKLPELLGVALVGGLIGRRAVRSLRHDRDEATAEATDGLQPLDDALQSGVAD